MIRGILDGFRQGRDEAIAGYGRRRPVVPLESEGDEPTHEPEQAQARPDDLESALRTREAEHEETKRLLAEVTDYAEQLQARVTELEAVPAPLIEVLRLPGVKTMLVNRFHPEKYPKADADTRRDLTEALQMINAAYDLVDRDGK